MLAESGTGGLEADAEVPEEPSWGSGGNWSPLPESSGGMGGRSAGVGVGVAEMVGTGVAVGEGGTPGCVQPANNKKRNGAANKTNDFMKTPQKIPRD